MEYLELNRSGATENCEFLSTFQQRYGILKGLTVSADDLKVIYQDLRPANSLSLQQTRAAIEAVCLDSNLCFKEDILSVLKEMDRRSFLMRDISWEFKMLDRNSVGTITEEEACFLHRARHGNAATEEWASDFLAARPVPGSRVSLAEIEVSLCNQKSDSTISDAEDELQEKDAAPKCDTAFW